MPVLTPALAELLSTGQIAVTTRAADGVRPVLVTRFGIGGDILTEVDRGFAGTPDGTTIARHRLAVTAALAPLRRIQRSLAWVVNGLAACIAVLLPLAPVGTAIWRGATDALTDLVGLAASAAGAALGAAAFVALRRRALRLVARLIARRFATIGQGGA